MDKPVCQPCLRNQSPICSVLAEHFVESGTVLELASGTGQHCVYFAEQLPHLVWQSSELPHNLDGIRAWLNDANLSNTPDPVALDLSQPNWPIEQAEYGFCANLLHYISDKDVYALFAGMAQRLPENGLLACYGPINENGYTSEGNAQLDQWLQQDINPLAGIKEIDHLQAWAQQASFRLERIIRMPANNVILLFKKTGLV